MTKKKILGLDIGVSSVGLALITEDENNQKSIEKMAVRIVPEDPDFHGKFYSGNTASKNLARTTKRGIRRSNQRFKLRRDRLYKILKEAKMFPGKSLFDLDALSLYGLRARAVNEKITLEELGRVLILLNQRRGFLSNRKADSADENLTEYKQKIEDLENDLGKKTIGQRLYEELASSSNIQNVLLRERTYLRNSYLEEFDRIWDKQNEYYAKELTGNSQTDDLKDTLYEEIRNKIIFYQRPLKSQKGLVSDCEFERHHKATSKSSPFFEMFRAYQRVNDLNWKNDKGELFYPTKEQKDELIKNLLSGENLTKQGNLPLKIIKSILGCKVTEKVYFNFEELEGSRTASKLRNALKGAGIEKFENYLKFDPINNDEKGGLFELWHITYSLPTVEEIVRTLTRRFPFTKEQALFIADNVHYKSDYGKLSTRAIRKLIPYLKKGLNYSSACDEVGYDHSGYKTKIELKDKLEEVSPNSLRNPVVEQVLNQVVNSVNLIIEKYGKLDEVRVELARELRNSAKSRSRISRLNSSNKKDNDKVRQRLHDEYGLKVVNGRDVKRYNLWKETNCSCLYCDNPITKTDFLSGNAELEHILPKSRSFSNAMTNFILAHKKCNASKNQLTAYDFMESKGEHALKSYIEKVNKLHNDGKGSISRTKFENLMCSGDDIPSDFVERMKKDSQYIAKETVKLLRTVCENTFTTTGQVTDLLRSEWGLKNVLEELGKPLYKELGLIETKEIKDSKGNTKTIERIKDWTKRDDHRHHAVDALICALTDQKIIFKLNNLNKIFQYSRETLSKYELAEMERINENKYDLKEFFAQGAYEFKEPIENLRPIVKKHLNEIFISFKKSNSKVLTKNLNRIKNADYQVTWVPRAGLHEDTIMGKRKRISKKKILINKKFNSLGDIIDPEIKEVIKIYLEKYGNNPSKAFDSKNLKKDPLVFKGKPLSEVQIFENTNSKRVAISESVTKAQLDKVIDEEVKKILNKRVDQYGGIKAAFKNIVEDPIYFNQEKGIVIKHFSVYDESKAINVRDGVAKTGGNHHALIYKDENGKYSDKVISFNEAVQIGLLNVSESGKPYPIIIREDDPDLGKFQFSMQINDLFVFDLKHSSNPQDENELDFFDIKNRELISKKLFRVQKMSKKSSGVFELNFRHHLESTINRNLPELTWINMTSNKNFYRLTKVKINHLGDIIKVGE